MEHETSVGCSSELRWSRIFLRPENERGTRALSNGTKMKFIAQVFPKNVRANVKVRSLPPLRSPLSVTSFIWGNVRFDKAERGEKEVWGRRGFY